MFQVAVEQEVEDFLGRGHYRRGSRKQEGWRNGYEPGKVKTANGLLEIALPQLRAQRRRITHDCPRCSEKALMSWGGW